MRRLYVYLIMLFMVVSCDGQLVRSDLAGKPLTADDFSIIYRGRVLPCFMVEGDIPKNYGNLEPVVTKDFLESYKIKGVPQVYQGLETKEYTNGNIRIVYNEFAMSEREDNNLYFIIMKKATTVRGISIGDSIDNVFEIYGQNEYTSKYMNRWYSEYFGFSYEYYGRYDSKGLDYPFFDVIYFHCESGKVVAIEYRYKMNHGQ